MLRSVIEGGAIYVPYCAGTRANAEEVSSPYRFRPTVFAGYFLEVEALEQGNAVVRHVDRDLGPGWLLFQTPRRILRAVTLDEVSTVIEEASRHADLGGFSLGLVSYEAGPAFDAAIRVRPPHWPLLAWFGLYDQSPLFFRELAPVYEDVEVSLDAPDMSPDTYAKAFAEVRAALSRGDSYQVNLTFRQPFTTRASAVRFFFSRCGIDPPSYATFLDGGDWQVASFSPELLFERIGDEVTTKPMKGTTPVPGRRDEWAEAVAKLTDDPKSRAENIMIVDMARNDLGAVSEIGSVRAPQLLQVERHRGLLQMTSTVTSRSSVPTPRLFSHLFPAASITGAPKVAATQIIRDLELSPRHVYCGSIGVMGAGWQRFSVAIRTALFRGGEAEFGIGSGIVWDSKVEAEYEECLAKRDLLLNSSEPWRLVEALATSRLDDSGYVDRHLDRLVRSANALGISFDREDIRSFLINVPHAELSFAKVRIALRRDGQFSVTFGPSWLPDSGIRGTLATRPVASQDPNFKFKTNSRSVLQGHLDEHPEYDEVLLYNEKGELTEFCRGNLVVEIEDRLFTPPFDLGCLPGIQVSELIAAGEVEIRRLTVEDLPAISRFYLSNSVVGLVEIGLLHAA